MAQQDVTRVLVDAQITAEIEARRVADEQNFFGPPIDCKCIPVRWQLKIDSPLQTVSVALDNQKLLQEADDLISSGSLLQTGMYTNRCSTSLASGMYAVAALDESACYTNRRA